MAISDVGEGAATTVSAARPWLDPELAPAARERSRTRHSGTIADLVARRAPEPEAEPEAEASVAGVRVQWEHVGEQQSVRVCVLRPEGVDDADPDLVLLYVHGGGYVAGNEMAIDPWLVPDLPGLNAWLVSPAYRLAPENPYPAGLSDVDAVLAWTQERAAGMGARLALIGSSAGAGLATGLALRRLARGEALPDAVMLLAPMLDDRTTQGPLDDGELPWSYWTNATAWSALLGTARAGGAEVPAEAAPARAEADDLAGFPPTYLDVGAADIFVDETAGFAGRLGAAGSPVEFHVWPGAFHGFTSALPQAAVSRAAAKTRRRFLRSLIEGRFATRA